MFKNFLTVIIVFLTLHTSAQTPDYNSDGWWGRFHLQPEGKPIPRMHPTDSCLVFVTNRHLQRGNIRFVDEFVDTGSLKYFLLQKKGEEWNVYQVDSLGAAMQALPQREDVVIYAEGMGKIFTANVDRALLMRAQYPVNVIMFDYASINSTYRPSKNFRFARANAALSAPEYLKLMQEVQRAKTREDSWTTGIRITAFFHSMGNIIMREMMLTQNYAALNTQPFLDNLILNAACVPQKKHKKWVEQIRFANKVYIDYNKSDWQLKGAHFITFAKQLGERPRRPRANNAVYIDFKDQAHRQHSYFLNFPQNDYRMTPAMKEYFSAVFDGHGAVAPLAPGNTNTISSTLSPAAAHQDTPRQ
jgi:hypothetical protein